MVYARFLDAKKIVCGQIRGQPGDFNAWVSLNIGLHAFNRRKTTGVKDGAGTRFPELRP